ncbi:NIF3-like protein 1 [Colossoma macropomum]|uniref:NIF3-like protein 1 n=1 Tax=Colossoma macropomum TaxID=42526 RepID=UPI00186462D1|nr:NIF3-like protein 1 [Colossoma macropomum]
MFSECRNVSGRLFTLSCRLSPLNLSCSATFKSSRHSLRANFSTRSCSSLRYSASYTFCNRPVLFLSRLFSLLSSPPRSLKASRWLSQAAVSMELKAVLEVLEQLAPLSLAESWDNVGLLVEPSKPRPVKAILLTNDLTSAVMDEAEAMQCDLIVSYHPPLFRPFKRLVQKDWKQRLAVRAIEGGIAVFSPHTSWDSAKDGLNDWLIGGLGGGRVSVLSQALCSAPQRNRLEFTARSQEELDSIMKLLKETENSEAFQYTVLRNEEGGQQVILTCPSSALTPVVQTVLGNATASQSLSITQVQQPPMLGCGQGRHIVLDEPVSVAVAVQRMKTHLGLPHLRLALGEQRTLDTVVKTAAVCAGSGASVLQGVKADLYITGEMSHHEVLDAVAKGTSVILSDHSNSERGFLSVFKERLAARLPDSVTIAISRRDRDPLEVV